METQTIIPTIAEEMINAKLTAGGNNPYWLITTEPLKFEKLNRDIQTDILIIGGGIAGISCAYNLVKAGRKVIVVEDGFIGSGETGRTTAHITYALDDRYYNLEEMYNTEKATLAANSHMAAIEWIAKTIRDENINCDFKRVNGYLFLSETDDKESLQKEYEATQRIGLPTTMMAHIPDLSAEEGKECIQFPEQGQFHVMKYLKGLCKAITESGGHIFTETKAADITSEGATANGFNVTANHIIVATNTPINNRVTMHTKQWPYRTYVIAAQIPKNIYSHSLWWDTGEKESEWISDPYHYVRIEEMEGPYDLLISGGEDHRTGQADPEENTEIHRYQKLYEWTKKRFPEMQEIVHQWSGQVMEPVDSLAYIGKNPGDENIYIITGDSGNGMTHGTLGGIILTDIILGRENPWSDLYSPSRITLSATSDYLQEVGNMVAQFGDWFSNGDRHQLSDLKAGEGAILSSGFKKAAAYRDENNKLHLCSAVCPHLGGILQWNADEKSFDCPLHGSRFTTEGVVINGPATCNLNKIEGDFD